MTTSNHDQITRVEFDVVLDLASLDVDFGGVVDLNMWIWIADCAAIVSDNHWNTLWTHQDFLDLAQLVLGLVFFDTVDCETTLHVIDKAEELVGLLN